MPASSISLSSSLCPIPWSRPASNDRLSIEEVALGGCAAVSSKDAFPGAGEDVRGLGFVGKETSVLVLDCLLRVADQQFGQLLATERARQVVVVEGSQKRLYHRIDLVESILLREECLGLHVAIAEIANPLGGLDDLRRDVEPR